MRKKVRWWETRWKLYLILLSEEGEGEGEDIVRSANDKIDENRERVIFETSFSRDDE